MKILYTRPDGGVTIVIPVTDDLEEVYAKAIPLDATNVREIEDTEIPSDRLLRNAWIDVGSEIKEDKVKSQDLVKEMRNRALKVLDTRAWEESRIPGGDIDTLNIVSQTLRDIPQREEFTTTTDTQTYKNMLDEIQGIIDQNK